MGHYSQVRRPFLLATLLITSNVALAAGQGHGQRNPRMGNKGANQAKLAQRAAQQQRAQQQRAQQQQAQRRAEAQQDRTRADQPKSPAVQVPQQNRPALDQQRSQPVAGQPGGPARALQDRQNQIKAHILERVGLSQDQRDRMARIGSAHDEEIVAAGRRIRQAQRGVDEAIMNQFNQAEVNRRIEDLAQATADRVRVQQRMRSEMFRVLTPEQVIKFNEVQREMQKKIQEQRLIEMQQTSPDKSPSGDQSRTSEQPGLDMIDIFLAKTR